MKSRGKEKKESLLLISAGINVIILIALALVFYAAFETNDDSGLIAIVGGSRGARDPHMVHMNYLMGLLIAGLFRAAPSVQWTAVLQYVVLFCSFVAVTYALFRKFRGPGMRMLITAVIAWFSYEGYIRIQYSKTAGLITAMGLAVVFCALLEDDVSKPLAAIGCIIAVIGSFYRFQQFGCEVALFAAMVLYLILVDREKGEERKGRIIRSLALGMALLVAVFGLRAFDRVQYSDPDWAEYLEFDKYRTEVIDYGVPDYDEHSAEYEAIGIDRTAYDLMMTWTFEDSEKFTADTFRQITEMKPKKSINAAFIRGWCRGLAKGLMNEGTFLCFAVVAAGWLVFGRHKKAEILSIAALAVIILALYFYLYYAGRFMVHRVDAGIWLAASLMVLYMYDEVRWDKARVIPAVLIFALFIAAVPWKAHLATTKAGFEKKAAAERSVIEELNSDRDHVYLTKPGVVRMSAAYGAFDAVPFGIADNIYPLGGWGAETPVFKSVLRRFGIENPMRDMIDNESVYIVDDNIDTTVAYLRKWYDPDAKAEKVRETGGRNIYRIVTE